MRLRRRSVAPAFCSLALGLAAFQGLATQGHSFTPATTGNVRLPGFSAPTGVAVDPLDAIFYVDVKSRAVGKLLSDGHRDLSFGFNGYVDLPPMVDYSASVRIRVSASPLGDYIYVSVPGADSDQTGANDGRGVVASFDALDGSPNPNFGTNGILGYAPDATRGFQHIEDVSVQADGRVLVADSRADSDQDGSNGNDTLGGVFRFNPDGSLDTALAGTGFLYRAGFTKVVGVTTDALDRILVVDEDADSNQSGANDNKGGLWRFGSSGVPDAFGPTAFGTLGFFSPGPGADTFGFVDPVSAVVDAATGLIYVADATRDSDSALPVDTKGGVHRVLPDGAGLDLTFTATGFSSPVPDPLGFQEPSAIAMMSDGTLLVADRLSDGDQSPAGGFTTDGCIFRMQPSTALFDPSFMFIWRQGFVAPNSVLRTPSLDLYVTDGAGALFKFNTKGQLDATFGDQGVVRTPGTSLQGVAIDSASNIYVCAPEADSDSIPPGDSKGGVYKFTSAGILDGTFGAAGFASTPTGDTNGFNQPVALAFDTSGTLLVVDSDADSDQNTANGNDAMGGVFALDATTGAINPTVFTSGFLPVSGPGFVSADPNGIAVEAGTGNFLVSDANSPSDQSSPADTKGGVFAFQPDGSRLATFGTSGYASLGGALDGFQDPSGVALDGTTRLIVTDRSADTDMNPGNGVSGGGALRFDLPALGPDGSFGLAGFSGFSDAELTMDEAEDGSVGTNSVVYVAEPTGAADHNTMGIVILTNGGAHAVDVTGPVIAPVPPDALLEATSPAGAVHTWAAPTGIDAVYGPFPVNSDHLSGDTFPLGATAVTFTSTDEIDNTTTDASMVVTVQDTTSPVINGPTPGTLDLISSTPIADTDPSITNWYATVSASDLVTTPCLVVNNGPSTYPLGTTLVLFYAIDDEGNDTTTSGTVRIVPNANVEKWTPY